MGARFLVEGGVEGVDQIAELLPFLVRGVLGDHLCRVEASELGIAYSSLN